METEFFMVIGVFPVELLACQVSMFCTAALQAHFFRKWPFGEL